MKVRKKPIIVEAIQITGTIENANEIHNKFGSDNIFFWKCHDYTGRNEAAKIIGAEIKTLEGNMVANIGDYIIRGVHGELYPCKPDIFEETYEVVND